jgi:hypothetical protein
MIMKKIIKNIAAVLIVALVFSCNDSESPMETITVEKGTLLALRGTQLDNIYFQGTPGAEFFPTVISGNEKFEFDAEYLAEDPSTLESMDIYVLKKNADATTERVFLRNVSGSEFKTTSDYLRPWVSVSINLTEILSKIGLADYKNPTTVQTLLDVYKYGVNLEIDLNLTDGSQIPASSIVAAGLFQSDQFYPAQKLTYAVTNFCVYDNTFWAGTYTANEVYSNSAYGPYDITFVQDPVDKNKFTTNNFWDSGITAYIVFSPSIDDPDQQEVTFPEQDDGDGNIITGTGRYDQCTGVVKIQTNYLGYDWRYEFTKQ